MNKEEFLDVNREGWWLVDPTADATLQQLRDQLGAALGYESEQDWYTKPERLEPLWNMVESRTDLATRLEQAADPDQRKLWIETVTETKEAEKKASVAPDPPAATPAGASASTSPAASAATTASKPSPFHKKDDSQGTAPPAQTESASGGGAPTARPSPFARKAVAETGTAAPAATTGSATETTAHVEHVDVEELKTDISDLLENPSINLDAAQVDKLAATPAFDERLAEATAALQAEAVAADNDEDEYWDDEEDEDELEPAGES